MLEECAQFGWTTLAEMLGKSKRSCMRRKKELHESGAIFYTTRINSMGRKYKGMFFFPSLVKAYLIKKSERGEIF